MALASMSIYSGLGVIKDSFNAKIYFFTTDAQEKRQ